MLTSLQRGLRSGDLKVTVAVHDGATIAAMWPGFHDVALGVAFDVGSTTVAGHLCDLHTGQVLGSAGSMNPQIRFGEDLMSRVSYVMMHPGPRRADRRDPDVRRRLIADLCGQAGADATDVLELTIVGNPIMHHLFLGLDPTELGGAPFALATDEAVHRGALELDLTTTNAGARVYVLPCIAGHVGADTAGVILEAPHDQAVVNLIVDVGTNAEIVLGDRDRLLAASSPTGPAFEGAQISCGQRAAPGAIERVRIDRQTLEPRFRGDRRRSVERRAGFDATTVTGVAGSGIIEAIAELFLAGVVTTDGAIDGSLADRSERIEADGRTFSYVLHDVPGAARLVITQNDVRQIQLAKGPCTPVSTPDGRVRHRDRRSDPAGRRVRRPHRPGPRDGARSRARLRPRARHERRERRRHRRPHRAAEPGLPQEIEAVVRRVEKLETAVEPRFQEHFVGRWASRTPPIRSRGWAPSSIFRHGASSRRATAPPPRTHQPTREEQHVSDDTGATSEATPRRRRTGGREDARPHASPPSPNGCPSSPGNSRRSRW